VAAHTVVPAPEMQAIPEEPPTPEPTALNTAVQQPARASPKIRGSQMDVMRESQMSDRQNVSSKLRESVLASIRGFRKVVTDVFAKPGDAAPGSPSPTSGGGSQTISFTPVAPITPVAGAAASAAAAGGGAEDAKVGQSEMYAPFFRMLRMGVPIGAVKN